MQQRTFFGRHCALSVVADELEVFALGAERKPLA